MALLAMHAICNIAAYRAGRKDSEFVRRENFWIRLNGNFLDVALLEWCKIFGDTKAAHYWGKVVTDAAAFELGLLKKLGCSRADFDAYVRSVRVYRDKFVAHLDSELVAKIPKLDMALTSAEYLLDYMHQAENEGDYYQGIPDNAATMYRKELANARTHYSPRAT